MNKSGNIYEVKIAKDAVDFIKQQSKKIQRQIINKINHIAENPQEYGRLIKNSDNQFKVRAGNYRIAYKLLNKELIILVVRVGHRKDFYEYYNR